MKSIRFIAFYGTLLSLMVACTGVKHNPTVAPSPQVQTHPNSYIAYVAARKGRSDVYLLDLKTRKEVNLTASLDLVQNEFDWSPDGTRIVVTTGLDYKESELFLIDVNSGQMTQLTDNETMDMRPVWSPNGKWIAFQSGVNTQYGSKIWYIDLESLEKKPLSEEFSDQRGYNFAYPVWSPDSRMIAAGIQYAQDTVKRYVFGFPSGQVIKIIGPDDAKIASLVWSPDGQMISYTSDEGGFSSIYMQPWADESRSQLTQLVDLPGSEGWLEWSPDSKTILFMNVQKDNITYTYGPSHIYAVAIDSLEVQQLTKEGSNFTPNWSPDGEKIVFGTARDESEFIAIMNRDGSELMILEETQSDAVWSPKWAPVSGTRYEDTSLAASPTTQPSAPPPGPTIQPSMTPPSPAAVILAPDASGEADSASLEKAREILQSRLDGMLERKAQVAVEADNLRVELASTEDISVTVQLAGQVGALVFFDSAEFVQDGTLVPEDVQVIMTDVDISEAQAGRDPQTGEWIVALRLTSEGAQKLADYTQANTDRFLVIAYDGSVISSPHVREPILHDSTVITGDLDQVSARSLAAQLNSGRLPFKLVVADVIR